MDKSNSDIIILNTVTFPVMADLFNFSRYLSDASPLELYIYHFTKLDPKDTTALQLHAQRFISRARNATRAAPLGKTPTGIARVSLLSLAIHIASK